jgi:hypothetical protein
MEVFYARRAAADFRKLPHAIQRRMGPIHLALGYSEASEIPAIVMAL